MMQAVLNDTNAHVSENGGIVFDFISRLWYYFSYTDGDNAIIAATLHDNHHFLVATLTEYPCDITLDPVSG